MEIQNLLFQNLTDKKYRKVIQLSRESDDVKLDLDSKYKLSASIDGLIKKMQFPNTNYGKISIPKSIRLHNVRAMLKNTNVLPNHLPLPVINTKIPEFCVGAYVDLEKCVDIVFENILSVISLVPGASLDRVLDGAFFLGCCDGAIFDSLQTESKNITTFSVTLVSRFLVENCGIYPSSKNWILTHFQLNGNESVGH